MRQWIPIPPRSPIRSERIWRNFRFRKGLEKKIRLKRSVLADGVELKTCPTCNGSGQVTTIQNTILGQMRSASVCPHCGGSGKVVGKRPPGVGPDGMTKKEETIKIKIPEIISWKKDCKAKPTPTNKAADAAKSAFKLTPAFCKASNTITV